ncbi:MAG: phosphoribosylamine--glycine ligase [Gemmatimonadaceae bacterium]|nr:phosphoribosylamine--glycine ligase [Gemmatimonadaceae bacterium]
MKLLIVGGGGREHALAWKLKQDSPSVELIAAPGNPGIAEYARCLPVALSDVNALASLAEEEAVDLTVVGPEAPLEAGISDMFARRGLNIFGPTAAAARIETSKAFAKDLMVRAGVPTGRAETHTDPVEAKRAVAAMGAPVVVKASGLAAGKGVIVAQSSAEANRAVDSMLSDRMFGAAGREILVEEFLEGEELSLFVITDGKTFLPFIGAQDHKRLLDGDLGPNTGGMGAYAPASLATPALISEISSTIIEPTLAALRECGSEFRGLLYAGLMLTRDGPKVIEFNCRFGDPETQAILPLMTSSLLELLLAVGCDGSLSNVAAPSWSDLSAVTTVIAAEAYPERPRKGDAIHLPKPPAGVQVFHSGTAMENGQLVTNGGRVLTVTAVANSVATAAERSRAYAGEVVFSGKQFRRDIGWREVSRSA